MKTKRKIFRKGAGAGALGWIVGLFFVIILIIIGIQYANKAQQGGKDIGDIYDDVLNPSSSNYDGDSLTKNDPCPCGSLNTPEEFENEPAPLCKANYDEDHCPFTWRDNPKSGDKQCYYSLNQCNDYIKKLSESTDKNKDK